MITMGIGRLISLWPRRTSRQSDVKKSEPGMMTRLLIRIRPLVFQLPISGRAFATGLLTAFLPCGWLYVFAFVAAGTATPLDGLTVMVAFWIGTVPLLTGMVFSATLANQRFRMAIPFVGSILLVATGAYTASGNGFASKEALPRLKSMVNETEIDQLGEAPLPCCQTGCDA